MAAMMRTAYSRESLGAGRPIRRLVPYYQTRDDGSLDQGGISRGSEKYSDCGYVLKKTLLGGAWVAQLVEHLPLAQIMIPGPQDKAPSWGPGIEP